uniref:tRNA (guanine(27)-N(2))-dimethyltransferase n=1 Tax=Latimeria chalumnae TaxID=7897 RepID=H3AIV7_LATCH
VDSLIQNGLSPCEKKEDESTDVEMQKQSLDEETKQTKHISIQKELGDLENLADIDGGELSAGSVLMIAHLLAPGKKPCPLCPEEKFKSCYSYKLRRHLQNLHWKVSVEFEGHRMCICHLPCRQMKPNLNGEQQPSSRLGAHYHCIVCSATIARRTDMISHIKRHVNKGETEAGYTGGFAGQQSSYEIVKEADTDVQVLPNHSTPQKTDSYFNPKMKSNRLLVFCSLATLAEERSPLECLDAFGATGIMGLQWAKHLGTAVKVTINDINDNCVKMIRENCQLNRIKVTPILKEEEEMEEEPEEAEDTLGTVKVTNMDANVILHLRAFDFIHLDPFGTAVNYLDAAFRNVRNHGIVSITSTDTSSLYSKAVNVAIRHYGCNIVRTEYYKELAARVVITAVARAAARCNKGIEVLFSLCLEHFALVVVRVLRGPTQADETVKKIRHLIHCQWCEERVFQKEGNMLEESPYRQLPCDCHDSMPGKTAAELGPMWSGTLFNTGFLKRMLFEAIQHGIDDIQPLIKSLLCEAECTTSKQLSLHGSGFHSSQEECGVYIKTAAPQNPEDVTTEYAIAQGKRKGKEVIGSQLKRQKSEVHVEHPPFYYSIHRHSIRGMNIPKLNKFLQYLTEAGFRVSRTHFDPTGVRTDATLEQFKSVLMTYSVPTYTGGQSGTHSHSTEDVKSDHE